MTGEYYCQAENLAGVAKMYLFIDVVAPPQFSTTFNSNVELYEHGTAIVTCEAQGLLFFSNVIKPVVNGIELLMHSLFNIDQLLDDSCLFKSI